MEFDERAAAEKRWAIREAAADARHSVKDISDEELDLVVKAFSQVTPPEEPELTLELITISSLYTSPKARSRKPGNILLNWRKLVDIVPDVSLAGLGAATLPIGAAWSSVLAGLYVWNKIWRGAVEELTDAEAVTILALWKHRNGENKISEEAGFNKTNELRANYSLPPLTMGQFASVIDRLKDMRCIELDDGIVWLREWIRVKYHS